jgi:hypothetical protein
MTGSVARKSTADMVAPAREEWRYRNVQHFPRQRWAPKRAGRPQAAPQLHHSDAESKIHFDRFHPQAAGSPAASYLAHASSNNRRIRLDNFENTSRWQILQCLTSE